MNLAVSTTPSPLQLDAGPLAWVIEQVRDNLLAALAAVRKNQQLRVLTQGDDSQLASGSLLHARHQVHQAAGAIDLLGFFAAARLAQAAERVLTRYIDHPEGFDDGAQSALQSGLHALLDYLDAQRSGKQEPALKLFKQYRDLMERASGEAAHPADLWDVDWTWPAQDDRPPLAQPLQQRDRAEYERALLDVLRQRDLPEASAALIAIARSAQAKASGHESTLWWLAEGFFEALGAGLVPADVYAKRLCNRLNLQLKALLADQQLPSQRLAHELLFFCAQAMGRAPDESTLPLTLRAIGTTMHLGHAQAVDYERAYFGLLDPGLIQQARKRIAQVKDGWSQLSNEDFSRIGKLVESAQLLAQSLREIAKGSEVLPNAIERMVRAISEQRDLLTPDRVLEVATSVLFLEASFSHFQIDDPEFLPRALELAQRLERSAAGAAAGTFAPWMEDLYRRSSESQTLGSVVHELRHDMGTVERLLDAYFRDPSTQPELAPVPKLLAQMRGVLSVLGMDVGAQALGSIRNTIEEIISRPPAEEQARATGGVFDQLAGNIGTLGFMVDMLGYQPELAKTLFRFDASTGELRAIVPSTPHTAPPSSRQDLQRQAAQVADSLDQGLGNEQAAGRIDRLRMEATIAREADLSTQLGQVRELLDAGHDAHTAAESLRATATESGAHAAPAFAPTTVLSVATHMAARDATPASVTPAADTTTSPTAATEEDDHDLLDIFLEEAEEVIAAGHAGVQQLRAHASDDGTLTAVRRAFHTLKGSSRMVGLSDFGEAAWELEQVFNQVLAEQHSASAAVLELADRAFTDLEAWTRALRAGDASAFSSGALCEAARAMRGLPSVHPVAGRSPAKTASTDAEPIQVQMQEAHPEQRVPEPEFVDTWPTGLPHDVPMQDETADLPENAYASADHSSQLYAGPDTPLARGESPSDVEPFELVSWSPAAPEPPLSEAEAASVSAPQDASALASPPLEFPPLELPDAALLELNFAPESAEPAIQSPLSPAQTPTHVPLTEQGHEQPSALNPPELNIDSALGAPGALHTSAAEVAGSSNVEFQEFDAQAFDSLFAPAEAMAPQDRPPLISASDGGPTLGQANSVEAPANGAPAGDQPVTIDATAPVFVHEPDETALPPAAQSPTAQPAEPQVSSLALQGQPPVAQIFTLEAHRPTQPTPDENIKVVGDLRIPIPLYTIYLNEADELVRRLSNDISAWSLQPSIPIAEEIAAAAHQLRGSSRTVGLQSVGQMAEWLEQALTLQREQPSALQPQDPTLLVQVTDDIRRLLHQFAAGFLRPPLEDLVEALQAFVYRLQHHTVSARSTLPEDAARTAAPAVSEAPEAEQEAGTVATSPVPAPSEAVIAVADLTLRDSIDPELFPFFEDEASEILPGLSGALRQWESHPGDSTAPKMAMRLLHTFKGSARMAGAMALGDLAHSLESDIEALLATDSDVPSEQALLELIARQDALNARFERLREASSRGEAELGELHVELGLQEQDVARSDTRLQPAEIKSTTGIAETADAHSTSADVAASGHPAPQPLTLTRVAGANIRVAAQPVRVRAALLDRLVNQVGEVSIARARLDNEFGLIRASTRDLGDNLERLRAQVRDIELQADAQMAARAQAAREDGRDFDPLEFDRFTRFQELTRMMAESVNDLALVQTTLSRTLQSTDDNLIRQARLTRELQRDLLRTRMVEFDSISERLYRTVRQAGKDASKSVRLDIQGGTIEIDRGVLDRMAPTFEHILRNAVAHGLEGSMAREAAGKALAGTITLRLHQEGSEVVVSIADDGAGLDYAAIERKARATGLLQPDEGADEAQLRELIFRPGFSSTEQTTEMAGRGVGLDVVRTDTRALGGRVELDSVPGQGTTFTLVLPLTTAVTQVVLLRAGEKAYAVPASLVDLVLRLKPAEVAAANRHRQLDHNGQPLPFYWLGALTADSGATADQPGRTIPVVLVRSAAQRLALQVDEVLGNQEVVVKNLGPQLSRVPGLAGISVLPNGNLVLIYNPVALAAVYGEQAVQRMEQAALAVSPVAPNATPLVSTSGGAFTPQVTAAAHAAGNTVLVVDDSITVRRVTQRFLSRNGYVVVLAKDGLDALEQLQGALPDVVLTDIEMPRMDGFDLTRNIRADERTRHLPVIMITSRIADKHRNYAQELGVNHYLGKPYSEDELLGLIRNYMPQNTAH
ncbi:MAG: response regulator [Proteobacteria bacterium]|nr:response regulator [Pseudomonadota bacterium]